MRCLSCERHVLFRVVLGFTRDAIIKQRHIPVLEKFKDIHGSSITFETPELTQRSMKGGVATIIIDKQFPNQQKKTLIKFAKELKKLIDSEDLDEGFIEIHEVEDVVELINWEYAKVAVCKK